MYLVVLGVLLLVMKVAEFGPVGGWSWWAVFSPFAGAAIWWAWADASGFTKQREMNKMDAKKRQRRIDNLNNLGMDAKGRHGRSDLAKQARRRF